MLSIDITDSEGNEMHVKLANPGGSFTDHETGFSLTHDEVKELGDIVGRMTRKFIIAGGIVEVVPEVEEELEVDDGPEENDPGETLEEEDPEDDDDQEGKEEDDNGDTGEDSPSDSEEPDASSDDSVGDPTPAATGTSDSPSAGDIAAPSDNSASDDVGEVEEEDVDEDDDAYTEDDLRAMPIAALRKLAKEHGATLTRSDNVDSLVAKILAAQEADKAAAAPAATS